MTDRTCLAAVFHRANQPLELATLDVPILQPGEVLAKVECCTVCGSDLHTITGARQEKTPTILGHEILARVTEVGGSSARDLDGNPLSPGDRITWSVAAACGECDRCQTGMPQKCRNLAKYGHEQTHGRYALSGGFAEYVFLRPGTAIVRIPDHVPSEVLCPANCATATVAAAYRMAGPIIGKRVLILGAGMLGLTAAAFARVSHAGRITVCDVSPKRCEQALQFGADEGILLSKEGDLQSHLHSLSDVGPFDVNLELSGAPVAVETALQCGDIGAHLVLVGSVMPTRAVEITPEKIVRNWLSIHGVHNYAPGDLQTAVDFLVKHGDEFPFRGLVEQTFGLREIQQAVEMAVRQHPVRVAIVPESDLP
ncbi:MAG: zinc-binding dehydrogenase [Planctomycetaceae bacterium]|nr:zinc-binding dehydrogenase [Planctomycetaceae bacterium]